MVAAVAENGVIGAARGIPWKIQADWDHFRAFTTGHVLVMGRTTHEGIGRPLPGRTTVVLTSDPDWSADGVHVARSVLEALEVADRLLAGAAPDRQVMVAGGAAVYAAAMPFADEQVISEVPLSPEGDTFYPAFDRGEWAEVRREPREGFEIVWWRRLEG